MFFPCQSQPIKQLKEHKTMIIYILISEWLLINTNSAIFQLYHDKNKLIIKVHFVRDDDEVCFVLNQHA
jgi:hypothetical protein